MARVIQIVDDITETTIDGEENVHSITLTLTEMVTDAKGKVTSQDDKSAIFEVSADTIEMIKFLIAGNLPEFLANVPNTVKPAKSISGVDSAAIRSWALVNVPGFTSSKGKLPESVIKAYRQMKEAEKGITHSQVGTPPTDNKITEAPAA